jgi:glycosyltransferase involved in cell wall biosynthesis
MDQDSGLRVYTERLVETMIGLDKNIRYLLLYRIPKWFGRFSGYSNVTEILAKAPHKFWWDQVSVPYVAWKKKADFIFNPKFSVPLISHCPVAMSLREPAWWAWREHYPAWNSLFMRTMIPLYCKKSVALFPISNFVFEENLKYQKLDNSKVEIAYPGPNKHFKRTVDKESLYQFKNKYHLPDLFVLSVTRVDHPGIEETKKYFPGKNPETTLQAYKLCKDRIPHKLVFAGRNIKQYLLDYGFSSKDFKDVIFLDFVPHDEIVHLYNLADLFVLPTFYESFGQTMVEAMSCGCPVVASTTGACPEIGGDAVLLADPYDVKDFSEKMLKVLAENELRKELKEKGINRAKFFNWERTANVILSFLLNRAKHKS